MLGDSFQKPLPPFNHCTSALGAGGKKVLCSVEDPLTELSYFHLCILRPRTANTLDCYYILLGV